jgi:hypothetical protein
MKCRWGVRRSAMPNRTTPHSTPSTVMPTAPVSKAGRISPNAATASITPAAKPSIASSILFVARAAKRAGSAPTPVARPAAKLAPKPRAIRNR